MAAAGRRGAGLLWALVLCGAARAAALGLSLHPPYFNLAATAGIGATATCGEDEGGRPRPELYCKLVGGPAAAPAIQVPGPRGGGRGRPVCLTGRGRAGDAAVASGQVLARGLGAGRPGVSTLRRQASFALFGTF